MINEKLNEIARDIIVMSRNSLVVNLRFMDSAVSRLELVPCEGTISVDGEHMAYEPGFILRNYKTAKELPARQYLHMLLHCVFQHFFIDSLIDEKCWDLACDIAVESMILELDLAGTRIQDDGKRRTIIAALKGRAGMTTAEKLYRYFMDGNESSNRMHMLAALFKLDDHYPWHHPTKNAAGNSAGNGSEDGKDSNDANGGSDAMELSEGDIISAQNELKEMWQDVSKHIQMDLESFSKERGTGAGGMMQNLLEVNREKYDYAEFLKRFAVMGEAMKINDDEFDYIFYTYGLNMYGKMPLIEPLEYKDVKKIKEFVIAIDTSGSVSGELVQKFVQKTYNILEQQENFFTRINLHIIQCDTEIQEDAKITSKEEFDTYLANMQLKGFGGTDFNPVFDYVNEMIDNGEFTNLKGLIYFTDGYGDFPPYQPIYNTAFVFIDDEYNNPDVPVWAIKLILKSDEI